jgi:hypothetical protein
LAGTAEKGIVGTQAVQPTRRHSRKWIAVGIISAAVAGLVFVLLNSSKSPRVSPSALGTDAPDLAGQINKGKRALVDGSFQLAAEHLSAAATTARAHRQLLSRKDAAALFQLQREVDLLAELLPDPLEDIVRTLEGLEYGEGQAVFQRRYPGKGVVFYSGMRRDPAGTLHVDYRLEGSRKPMRLDLQTLEVFRGLPLEEPVDVLFGAKLSSIERDALGAWVIAFQPDSGVLFTDEEPALACCFQPGDPTALTATLRRQKSWIERRAHD